MTQHTACNNNGNNSSRSSRRAGFALLAALGLPLGAMLAPGTAAAAPGDPLDDIDLDTLLPLDALLLKPADWIPQWPMPNPDGPTTPDGVPGPDDSPGLPFEVPELEAPFELLPFDPDDLVIPTDPDDEVDPGPADDEPECAEYAVGNFAVDAEHHEGDLIELRLVYSDMDVCDFTVWTAAAEPGAVDVLEAYTVGMSDIAFSTDSAGYHQQTLSHFDLCDVEVRVAVEESVAFTVPHTDPDCESGGEEAIPGDDGEEPGDDGETPEGARPLGEHEAPGTPSGGLPQTGTDMTTVMLAIGLMTVGAGSVIALATRRREELPTT